LLKILDDDYYDLIVNNVTVSSYGSDDITLLNSLHSLRHVLKYEIDACGLEQNPYETLPALFTLTSSLSLEKSGIEAVQNNPEFSLFGQGVIVGIIDTGIDYQHSAFINNDKTTRILYIWDQTIQEGLPPSGFTFGTEYNKSLINNALFSRDPSSVVPSMDTNGHGTAIASIIAGNPDSDHSFSGIVPQSELVVVKLKEAKHNLKNIFFAPTDSLCFQESDIMLGIRYLTTVSQKLNRPLVICIALGSSQSYIWVNNISFESSTGDPVILIRFENPLPGIWNLLVRNDEKEPFSFHSWLPSGNLISDETFFLKGDPNTTITTPGNTISTLTVTAYNQYNDTILIESGRGYTRSGLIKPDIAAPGYQLPCAIPKEQCSTLTGTGAAAAHTAGVIAMILEWAYSKGNFTAVTGIQINRMIIREARRNSLYIYPNNIWGYGQINIYNILNRLSGI